MIADILPIADTNFESGYDPIQLKYDMGWNLETLADVMGVTESCTRKWSAKVSKPPLSARRLAYLIKTHIVS